MEDPTLHASPTSVSTKGIDKGSRIADTTPNFKFFSPDEYDFPVIVFSCTNVVGLIMFAKRWLLSQYNSNVYGGPEILRMETQEVEKVKHWEEGTVLLLENACWIQGSEGKVPARIMALVMPKDPRVRFWYSSIATFTELLIRLDRERFIELKKTLEPNVNKHHHRIYVWLRDAFMDTLKVPHHEDYLNAMTITDYSPDIASPETSLRRIEACEPLYASVKDAPHDLSDDRYIFELEPAERELASQVQVSCAEYLVIKRNFFKDWYIEVYRSDKKVKDGEMVRTNYAHEQWLEKVYEWTVRRSRRLIAGWKVLGLLDQSKIAPWAAQGGMLAGAVQEMGEEEMERLGAQAPDEETVGEQSPDRAV